MLKHITVCLSFAIWFYCLSFIPSVAFALAQSATYAVHHQVRHKQTVLEVYNRRTGKTIWKCALIGVYGETWSKNHRALAFVTSTGKMIVTDGPISSFTIGTWRAGEKVRLHPPKPYQGCDYVEFLVWSPDNKRLLVATGGSGEVDIGACDLTCLNLETGVAHRVASFVSIWGESPRWYSSHQVVYRKKVYLDDEHHHSYLVDAKKRYYYNCP